MHTAKRFEFEQQHAEQVTRLALSIFDQIRPLHGLGDIERELLEAALRLSPAAEPRQCVRILQVLRFVLTEGRNRQIRRMCELVELEVVDLIRVRVGSLKLGDLREGKWRHLTPDERNALVAASV